VFMFVGSTPLGLLHEMPAQQWCRLCDEPVGARYSLRQKHMLDQHNMRQSIKGFFYEKVQDTDTQHDDDDGGGGGGGGDVAAMEVDGDDGDDDGPLPDGPLPYGTFLDKLHMGHMEGPQLLANG